MNRLGKPGRATVNPGGQTNGTEFQGTSGEDGSGEPRGKHAERARGAPEDGSGRNAYREETHASGPGRDVGRSSKFGLPHRAARGHVSQHAEELHSRNGRRTPDSGNLSRWRRGGNRPLRRLRGSDVRSEGEGGGWRCLPAGRVSVPTSGSNALHKGVQSFGICENHEGSARGGAPNLRHSREFGERQPD